MIINACVFILVLSGLVFFHELGHFVAARFFGVGVEKFSIGIGPRVFGYRIGITDYCFSAIPLGGYVKMVGDEQDSKPADISKISLSFAHKHVLKKIIIVLAGPIFNVVFAIIVLCIIFSSSGVFILRPVLGSVIPDMPANTSGLTPGDTIISIDRKEMSCWEDIAKTISNGNGSAIEVVLDRNGTYSKVYIQPILSKSKNVLGQEISKYVIGITHSGDVVSRKVSCWEAIANSFAKTYDIASLTILSLFKLIHGSVSTKTLGGPIMIAEMTGHYARTGIIELMFFSALLSVNLAILNCLPIPFLDGGHFTFFVIEAIIRKPLSNKFRGLSYKIGAILLIILMCYVFYNDLARLFFN